MSETRTTLETLTERQRTWLGLGADAPKQQCTCGHPIDEHSWDFFPGCSYCLHYEDGPPCGCNEFERGVA